MTRETEQGVDDIVSKGHGSAPPRRWCASLPDRVAALLADAVALAILGFLAALLVSLVLGPAVRFDSGQSRLGDAVELRRGVAVVVAAVVATVTATYFIASWRRRGASPGQRLLGVTVAGATTGLPPGLRAAALRWLVLVAPWSVVGILLVPLDDGGWILYFPLAAWYLLLLATTARDPLRRGWHDRVAGTVVTRSPTPMSMPNTGDLAGDR